MPKDFISLIESAEVHLTDKCNLRCTYCLSRKDSGKELGLKEIKIAIARFLSYPNLKNISFTGGEPFLKSRLLEKAISYTLQKAKLNNKEILVNINTNGTLLDKATEKLCKNGRVQITVSIDGPKEINDGHRKFAENPNSSVFDAIGLDRLKKKIKNLRFSAVFNSASADDIYKNFSFFIKNNFFNINFLPVAYEIWPSATLNKLDINLNRVIKDFRCLKPSYSGRFQSNRFGRGAFNCSKIILGSDGKYYFCEKAFMLDDRKRRKMSIGDIHTGPDFAKRQRLLEQSKGKIIKLIGKRCSGCHSFKFCFCLIGLYYHCFHKNVNFKKHFESFCAISRIYFSNFLKQSFQRTGG